MQTNNTSGTTGVAYYEDAGGYGRWHAKWTDLSGKSRTKTFSVKKYGYETAHDMAVAARKAAIEALNLDGAGYTERHGE